MSLHLYKDWSDVVRILGKRHVGRGNGLADAASVERGSVGEEFVRETLEDADYHVTSYGNSQTQADIWAIGSHQFRNRKTTSIVLAQVKTSKRDSFPAPKQAQEALASLAKDVLRKLSKADGSGDLPLLRHRLVVSAWWIGVKDGLFRNSVKHLRHVSAHAYGFDDTPKQAEALRDHITQVVQSILD